MPEAAISSATAARRPIKVAIVYHMHQPSYLESTPSGTLMGAFPYVRKHCLRAYHDMPTWALQHGVKVHFNITHSLVNQIEFLLGNENAADRHLFLTRKTAAQLTPEDKLEVLQSFLDTAVDPIQIGRNPRFKELYAKLNAAVGGRTLMRPGQLKPIPWEQFDAGKTATIISAFNTQDYLDIQVLSNLVMFGVENQVDRVAELLRKQPPHYTEQEKDEILRIQFRIIKKILDIYRVMQERGDGEITTSPYNHCIVPLVCDSERFGRPTVPYGRIVPYIHPDDARAQLHMAGISYERIFGRPPRGLWPSEGAVCNALFPLLRQALPSVWFVLADEGISKRSRMTQDQHAWQNKFMPWRVNVPGLSTDNDCRLVFRDRGLSDAIGWVEPDQQEAAAHKIIQDILTIGREYAGPKYQTIYGPPSPLVTLCLDGENLQECRPEDARLFFTTFYQELARLEAEGTIEMVLLSQIGNELQDHRIITDVWPGSWAGNTLHSNALHVWTGEEGHIKPWEQLAHLSSELGIRFTPQEMIAAQDEIYAVLRLGALSRGLHRLSPLARALVSLYESETSCFMWWYGGLRGSPPDMQRFDRTYRSHITASLIAAGLPVPQELSQPLFLA